MLHTRAAAGEAALLVPERDDGERTPAASDPLDRLEPGKHAEDTVEAPTVRHRVEVRAHPDLAGVRGIAQEAPEEVSIRVDLDGEPRFFQPAGDKLVCVLLGLAPADAIRAGTAADRVDLLDPLENPQEPSLPPPIKSDDRPPWPGSRNNPQFNGPALRVVLP